MVLPINARTETNVATVTGEVLSWTFPVVSPSGMTMEAVEGEASAELEVEKVTVTPPGDAAQRNTTFAVTLVPPRAVVGVSVSV